MDRYRAVRSELRSGLLGLDVALPALRPRPVGCPSVRAGAMLSVRAQWRLPSGGIGARGFRIVAPLLSLAATVLPLIRSARLRRSSHAAREHTIRRGARAPCRLTNCS